eukprot:1189536-Prorocentrum_minimum.AAC.3
MGRGRVDPRAHLGAGVLGRLALGEELPLQLAEAREAVIGRLALAQQLPLQLARAGAGLLRHLALAQQVLLQLAPARPLGRQVALQLAHLRHQRCQVLLQLAAFPLRLQRVDLNDRKTRVERRARHVGVRGIHPAEATTNAKVETSDGRSERAVVATMFALLVSNASRLPCRLRTGAPSDQHARIPSHGGRSVKRKRRQRTNAERQTDLRIGHRQVVRQLARPLRLGRQLALQLARLSLQHRLRVRRQLAHPGPQRRLVRQLALQLAHSDRQPRPPRLRGRVGGDRQVVRQLASPLRCGRQLALQLAHLGLLCRLVRQLALQLAHSGRQPRLGHQLALQLAHFGLQRRLRLRGGAPRRVRHHRCTRLRLLPTNRLNLESLIWN